MSNRKPEIKNRKSVLGKFRLFFEKTHPDKYVSPTAGKLEPWYSRLLKTITFTTLNFVLEIKSAIKTIIKEIM